jgi:hypothetical protein
MKRKKLSLYVCGCVKVYAIYFLACQKNALSSTYCGFLFTIIDKKISLKKTKNKIHKGYRKSHKF